MNIYYLGPKGSYSYSMLQKIYPNENLLPLPTFAHIVSAVMKEEGSIGLLGIENSISSSVHESIDLLFQNELCIVAEAAMDIQLHLIGPKNATLSDVKEVFSYYQAIAQCSSFIEKNALIVHETPSTMAAVHEVDTLQDKSKAAIAGRGALAGTDLDIIEEQIANSSHNMTRWVLVSKKPITVSKKINKLTVIFKVTHEPGSLVKVLQAVAREKGNMSKIESRPVPGSDWEYLFWIDVEIPEGAIGIFKALFKKETLWYRLVGMYEKGQTYAE